MRRKVRRNNNRNIRKDPIECPPTPAAVHWSDPTIQRDEEPPRRRIVHYEDEYDLNYNDPPPTPGCEAYYAPPQTPYMPSLYPPPPTPGGFQNHPPTPAPANYYHHPPATPGTYLHCGPPPTPGTYLHAASLAEDEELPNLDNNGDAGPLSTSSLDTSSSSSPYSPQVSSTYRPTGGYTGRGPMLSEPSSSESESEPAPIKPPARQPDPLPPATPGVTKRRRRLSQSRKSESPQLNPSVKASKAGGRTRSSRTRQRGGAARKRKASDTSSSPEIHGPPLTPRPVIRSDPNESYTRGYRVDDLLKDPSPAPRTPSPTDSLDRPLTPIMQRLRQMTPSPNLGAPPTPAVAAPAKVKSEARTPRAHDNPRVPISSNKKLTLYDPDESAKRMHDRVIKKSPSKGCEDNMPMPGTIKRVMLKNIMSHGTFVQEWSSKFNFVVGENGSGKSAILSGIVAGLGGAARDTGRASSMKQLIRNGRQNARIEITLNNCPSAMYGEEIKIVRSLSREGSSRYQIYDGRTGMRSLGRTELNLVLSKLNIQVDNPLAILHQETSRNFLRTNDPSHLYNFFYRALLLSSCESLMQLAQKDLDRADKTLWAKKQLLVDLRTKANDLKAEVELIESLKDGNKRLEKYKKEYIWSVVKEQEEAFRKARKDLDISSEKNEQAKEERAGVERRRQDFERNQACFDDRWVAINNQLRLFGEQYDIKRNEVQRLNLLMAQERGNYGFIEQCIVQQQRTLQQLMYKVQESEAAVASRYEQHQREIEGQRFVLQQQLAEVDAQLAELTSQQAVYLNTAANVEKKVQQHEMNVKELKNRMVALQQDIDECERAKTSKYDVYGKEMYRLVERIKQERRWRKPPRGPMGSCFTVKTEKWAPLIEYILGSNLHSFAVDNDDDRKLLEAIIDDVYKSKGAGRKPSLCVIKFGDGRINIDRGRVRCQYPTILDVIEINDFVVFNWLVDLCNIERIVLFDTYSQACPFMMCQRSAVNVSRGYSLDEYMFTPDPSYKALAQQKLKPTRFLKVGELEHSMESNTHHLKSELAILKEQHQRTSKACRESKQEAMMSKETENNFRKSISHYQTKKGQLTYNLSTLDTSMFMSDSTTYRDEIEELKIRIAEKERELETSRGLVQQLDVDLRANSEIVLSLEAQINESQNQQQSMQLQKQSSETEIMKFLRETKAHDAVVNETNKKKVDAMKKFHEAEKLLEQKLQIARTQCLEKIEVTRPSEELKGLYETLRAELKKNRKKINLEQDIKRQWKNAKANADSVEMEIQVMEALIRMTRPQIKFQRVCFDTKLHEYGEAIKACFKGLIEARHYKGDLVICHKGRTLMCYISADQDTDNRAKRNLDIKGGYAASVNKKGCMEFTGSMSGGERSFTTICFLISCWHLMDMPFYIVDEFDVFMDAMNRRIGHDIIMSVSESKPNCQFFIFSPNPMDTIKKPEPSKMIKLSKQKPIGQESSDDDEEPENRAIIIPAPAKKPRHK